MPQDRAMKDHANLGAVLADIVEEANALVLPLWRSGLAVQTKADLSPVTVADQQAEALILARLEAAFPDIPVISEEYAGEFGTPDAIGERFFLVDPIDGTKAFVRGDEHFTVNIGYVENGVTMAGAVGAPALGQIWHTTSDGAVRRSARGQTVAVHARTWRAGETVALVSHTMKPETATALAAQYGFSRARAVDSSIKLCLIADGQADIYPRHGPTMEWDIAAAHAVLEAAGGSVTTPDGRPFLYGKADQGFLNGWFVARGA
jgi:3'(2'), 5'-bisphosphate nucleotidase